MGVINYSCIWLDSAVRLTPRRFAELFRDVLLNGIPA